MGRYAIHMDSSVPTRGQDQNLAAEIVRLGRLESGLSQRAFAALAGTSGPTVAAYESGTKEPRLSTLQRLAAGADRHLYVRLVAGSRGAAQRARRERRSLAIAAATAAAVAEDFSAARALALENLGKAEHVIGDNAALRWVTRWREILDGGPVAVQDALLETTDRGHDMRQMTPFAGLLTEEARRAALAVADAFCQLAEVS